ncbi:MAG TPA: CBS domain-containing protein [Chitinophagales bacterium]|jgi:acetoin utilization protein AcuB|nr:CBS domain-containing protein [Chitinophagales bacterium]HQO32072.1 CBS domain-containing protein [Chitinophagales bacterium]
MYTFTENTDPLFAQDCINNSIPYLRLTDTAGYALDLMAEYKVDQLAVVDNGVLAGMASEQQLLDLDDNITLEEMRPALLANKVLEGTHVFDVVRKQSEFATDYLPVVTAAGEYLGLITTQKIVAQFSSHSALAGSGGIIVLEMEARDYSLAEIAKIVESNNALILHSMISTAAHSHQLQVSLKINKNDLKDIQLSFERYQYTVLAVLHQSEYEWQLKERYDSLMRYLEV